MNYRMLIVDDEPEILDSLKNLIERESKWDLDIDTAIFPIQALSLVEQNRYDIIMTDMKMPGMNGLEMINKIIGIEGNADLKVIFLTGYGDFDTLYIINKMENARYLLKNESDEKILEAVELTINEIPADSVIDRMADEGEFSAIMISKSKDYIIDHLDRNLSLNSIADWVNMSPSYFSRLFKQTTGENLSHYINKVRLDKAKNLIENSNMKIADISEEVGFESPAYFATYFKKATGHTPQTWRNMQQMKKTNLK